MSVPPKADPDKFCEICGVQFYRKRFNGRLEDRTRFLSRTHCSLSCGNSKKEAGKSAQHWRARKHRASACAECGATMRLHVHHIDRNPENNDPSNLMTLCPSCHLKLHWREDRTKRMQAMAQARQTTVSRGVHIRERSADGKWRSAGALPLQQNPDHAEGND